MRRNVPYLNVITRYNGPQGKMHREDKKGHRRGPEEAHLIGVAEDTEEICITNG